MKEKARDNSESTELIVTTTCNLVDMLREIVSSESRVIPRSQTLCEKRLCEKRGGSLVRTHSYRKFSCVAYIAPHRSRWAIMHWFHQYQLFFSNSLFSQTPVNNLSWYSMESFSRPTKFNISCCFLPVSFPALASVWTQTTSMNTDDEFAPDNLSTGEDAKPE